MGSFTIASESFCCLALDHSWFGIDDEYRIVVSRNRFTAEEAVGNRKIIRFRGEEIGLPKEQESLPSLDSLRWHQGRWKIATM